jgi:hypothetical protein
MSFVRLGLRMRLYLGFAVLVAPGMGVAGFGMIGLSGVTSSVDKMEAMSINVVRIQEVARQLEIIRRASNRYRIDADANSLTMDQVLAIAQSADVASQSVLTAAGDVGQTANTLSSEVDNFLNVMKSLDGDATET